MGRDETDTEWLGQLRRGVLELCVLAAIARKPTYGYDLVAELATSEPLAAVEGTVYPLLRRLRHAGLVETRWQESPAGPPRQYYRITNAGQRALRQMRRAWAELVDDVARVTNEEARA